MSKALTSKPDAKSSKAGKTASQTTIARLFFLDLGGGRVMSCNPDGSDLKTIVTEARKLPDGVVVDVEAGHIYWTNMGSVGANDGSIFRADLDGKNLTTIVPEGRTHTPKQLQLDKKNGKLYWSRSRGHARHARQSRRIRASRRSSKRATAMRTGAMPETGAWELRLM